MVDFGAALRREFVIPGVGTFTLRRPSLWAQPQIARVRSGILGANVGESDPAWSIAQTIALIDVTAEDKPKDFSWDDIYLDDDQPLLGFYKEYIEWMESFRAHKRIHAEADSGGSQS